MAIKHVYEIVNAVSGESLGGYEADDEQGALDALARDAGYADDAEMCRQVPRGKHELRVTLQSIGAPDAEITDEQLEALRIEAGQAGDDKMVAYATAALGGGAEARERCAAAIAEARAQG